MVSTFGLAINNCPYAGPTTAYEFSLLFFSFCWSFITARYRLTRPPPSPFISYLRMHCDISKLGHH